MIFIPFRKTPTTEYVVPKSIPTGGPEVVVAESGEAAAAIFSR